MKIRSLGGQGKIIKGILWAQKKLGSTDFQTKKILYQRTLQKWSRKTPPSPSPALPWLHRKNSLGRAGSFSCVRHLVIRGSPGVLSLPLSSCNPRSCSSIWQKIHHCCHHPRAPCKGDSEYGRPVPQSGREQYHPTQLTWWSPGSPRKSKWNWYFQMTSNNEILNGERFTKQPFHR